MSASEKKWFIAFSDHYEGPYTPRDIRHRIEEGTVEENPFVWCEGMPNWLRLTDTGLKLFPTPPPLPIRRPETPGLGAGAGAVRAATVRPAPSGPRAGNGGAVAAAAAPEAFVPPEEPAYEQFAASGGEPGTEQASEYGGGAEYAPEAQGEAAVSPGADGGAYGDASGGAYGETMGDGATAEGATAEYAGPETGGAEAPYLESPPEHGQPEFEGSDNGNGHEQGDLHGHDADGRDLNGLIRFDRGGDAADGRHSADGKGRRAMRLRLWWLLILLLATGVLALVLTRLAP